MYWITWLVMKGANLTIPWSSPSGEKFSQKTLISMSSIWLPCWPSRAAGTIDLSQLREKLFTVI